MFDLIIRDVAAHHTLGRHHIAAANHEIEHPASRRRQGPDAWLAQALLDAVFAYACMRATNRRILGCRRAA